MTAIFFYYYLNSIAGLGVSDILTGMLIGIIMGCFIHSP
jgi:hypothetical protein